MRTFIPRPFAALFLLWVVANSSFGATDMVPEKPSIPLFKVFIGIPMKGGGEGMTFDNRQPLLTVSQVRDLGLAADNKSVRIKLSPDDARDLWLLTRKSDKGFLILESEGRVLTALHVTKPIQDGVLAFKHPDAA